MEHILTAGQFEQAELFDLFQRAENMREAVSKDETARELVGRHAGKIVATLFYEPSTRTRLSFESAAQRLGMGIVSTENAAEFSSAAKGETIEDTTRVVAAYAHAIVMRHKDTGAAERAAAVSSVPVINAGDGTGEHPTQALLDAYTIFREKGRLDNLRVVIGGDLARGRTARSLARILSIFENNRITFVSPPELAMGQDVIDELEQAGTLHRETDDIFEAIDLKTDVVYWTRTQLERAHQSGGVKQKAAKTARGLLQSLRISKQASPKKFVIDTEVLAALPESAIIMHPLPRVGEITTEVDVDPRAAYFRQAENGLYIRMALLDKLVKTL